MDKRARKRLAILDVLSASERPLGSSRITDILTARGVEISERTVRLYLLELDELGLKWALVGGLAVGARAEPRTTRDIDVAVAVENDQQAEQLISHLRGRGYEMLAVIEQTTLERLATVRLKAPGLLYRVIVDLLFSSSGVEPEVAAGAEVLEIVEGSKIPIARTGHLIALKLLARDNRPFSRLEQDTTGIRQPLKNWVRFTPFSFQRDSFSSRCSITLLTIKNIHLLCQN